MLQMKLPGILLRRLRRYELDVVRRQFQKFWGLANVSLICRTNVAENKNISNLHLTFIGVQNKTKTRKTLFRLKNVENIRILI